MLLNADVNGGEGRALVGDDGVVSMVGCNVTTASERVGFLDVTGAIFLAAPFGAANQPPMVSIRIPPIHVCSFVWVWFCSCSRLTIAEELSFAHRSLLLFPRFLFFIVDRLTASSKQASTCLQRTTTTPRP
jgi:hypothetical protein